MTLREKFLLAIGLLCMALPVASQARDNASFDVYGYQAYASGSAQCAYDYVDASDGAVLDLSAASAAAPASDDGAAVVALAAPFELYGVLVNALVVSSNGYLAAAGDLAAEDGGDFSADCPLPAIADNAAASQSRIYAYHADLDGAVSSGTIRSRYFASCPRPSAAGSDEACSVVQWQDWALRGQSGALDMQVVLYHASLEIALQYQALDASLGTTATIGTQAPDALSGNAFACRGSRQLQAASAICLFDPRHPPPAPIIDSLFADGFDSP
ncbi:MAG: hypothetical protein BGP25_02090 [Lysobacterales bacterium 63-13]|nr:MAG: hypothetical protein BGP25_02090 [Xanthomonadales bacterium 63-13]